MQTGRFYSQPLMRLTLICTVLFLVGFWVTTFLMYFSKMDLTPASVAAYYNGSEATFTPPRTYGSMLEVTHTHLPVMALVALLLTHLFIFTKLSKEIKYSAIIAFFASAFSGEMSSWLVRFVHPGFAWLKIASFISLQISMMFVIYALLKLLLSKNKVMSRKGNDSNR